MLVKSWWDAVGNRRPDGQFEGEHGSCVCRRRLSPPDGDLSSQNRVLALCAITQNALKIARRWSSSETGMDRPSLKADDAAG